MDDTIILVKDYEYGKDILSKYKKLASILNIKINDKKSYITKLDKFKYCKWRYKLLNSGKVILIPVIDTIRRERKKLRKMINLNLSNEEIDMTRNSYKAYLSIGNTYRYIRRL